MNTPQTTIGLRLLSERKRLGLTQSQLSSKLGVGRAVIIRYENNGTMLSMKTIEGLVALGFNMDYVLNSTLQNQSATAQPISAIEQTIDPNTLTPTQKVRLDLLAKTHIGQQVVTDFLLNPTPATHELLANLEKLTQWVLEPTLQNHTNQSELIESAKTSSQSIANSHLQPITPEQFKANLQEQGKTLIEWSAENGYPDWLVVRLLNGQSKGTRGKAHECAVKMGIKADPALNPTQE